MRDDQMMTGLHERRERRCRGVDCGLLMRRRETLAAFQQSVTAQGDQGVHR
jgi:hypothetical protein